MKNIVVGIEGYVGSGKTSICRELLNIVPNSIVFHGGNLYRGIVYSLMKNKEKFSNLNKLQELSKNIDIKEIMDMLKVEFKLENRETVVYVEGQKIDEELLQSKEASLAVSTVGGNADNSALFVFARNIINKYKEKYNVIVSGRALMEIYPDLDYHFMITASLDERVKRKANQYGENINIKELRKHIELRDKMQEEAGFYKLYKNTITVDVTNCASAEESTKEVCKYIEELKLCV